MKVWGYYDASGAHDNPDGQGNRSPAVSVAGYLATPNQWQQFDKRWRGVLDEAGAPYFHATEFVARVGPYKGWPEEKRHKFSKDLVEVISGNVLYGVGMALLRADYEKVVAAIPAARKLFGSPYTFCSWRCFETGVDWARGAKYQESIKYIFESGDEFCSEVLRAHTKACEKDQVREFYKFGGAGSLTFEDGVKVTPLQAADFLAYELYKEMHRVTYPKQQATYTRGSFVALYNIPGCYKQYTEEDLMGYIDDAIKMVEREKEREDK